MRVAVVTEVWAPTVNGVVTRLVATVDQLLAEGHEVLVVAPSAEGTTVVGGPCPGVSVRLVPTVSLPFVYGGQPWGLPVPQVRRYLADFAPDLVHVVNPVSLGIAGVYAARRLRVPLVCSYHTDVAAYAKCYRLGWLRPVIHRHLRMLHGRADVNLVTSAAAAAQLDDLGVRGRADGRGEVALWQRGVDLERFRAVARSTVPALSAPGFAGGLEAAVPCVRPLRALYVGRIADEKRLEDLAPLAADPRFQLTVVGDGPARHRITSALPEGTHFTGTLHGEALASAYREADVFVFPSVTETLGLVLLEALASGLPIAAADSPAARELLGGCQAARLWGGERHAAGPVSAAAELLDSAPRAELSALARAEVEGWTWKAATSQLVTHYDRARALARPPVPVPRPAPEPVLPVVGRTQQLRRFLAVGLSNALIDLGLFNLFLWIHPTTSSSTVVAYNTVAVVVALCNSYLCNSRWTFGHERHLPHRQWHRRALFAMQGGVNIGVNDAVVALSSMTLGASGVLPSTVASNIGKGTAMIVASVVSFAAMRAVVFRNPRLSGGPPGC